MWSYAPGLIVRVVPFPLSTDPLHVPDTGVGILANGSVSWVDVGLTAGEQFAQGLVVPSVEYSVMLAFDPLAVIVPLLPVWIAPGSADPMYIPPLVTTRLELLPETKRS